MKLSKSLLVVAVLLLSSPTFAGQYKSDPVYIDLINQVAMGNLYATRFSDNPDERIGCAVANGDERGLFGYCEAKFFDPDLAELVSADCFTYDTKMIEAIASINTYSFVYFSWEQQSRKGFDDNVCTNVTVATRSTHIPDEMAPQVEGGVLGASAAKINGYLGLGGMYNVCKTEFGEGAMMCTTKQVLDSPKLADLPYGVAWVRPIVIQTLIFSNPGEYPQAGWYDYTAQVEYSGSIIPWRRGDDYPMGVRWCVGDYELGFALTFPQGSVGTVPCSYEAPVICCR